MVFPDSNSILLSRDVFDNFMGHEIFTFGENYRWDDSICGMTGFLIGSRLTIGYAQDYTISDLNSNNSDSHEDFSRHNGFSQNLCFRPPW